VQKFLISVFFVLFSIQVKAASMLEIGDGRIEYEIKQGGDFIVLFDAGALSGMAGWDAIWADLPAEITAIRFSRLGEGQSDPCTGQRDASDYVEEVEQLLVELKINKPIIYVSHSLGAVTARHFTAKHQGKVAALLMIDPENPRDVEIVKQLNPTGGQAEIDAIKKNDYLMGKGKWCFLDLSWDKRPALGFSKLGDIPVTLIAGVKVPENPSNAFESTEGRKLWGQYQSEWAKQFPQGKVILTSNSGHFIQDDEPDLVLKELTSLLNKLKGTNSN
jgi:pimeloyl-ACP methyl ester carboxylesterase